MLGSSRVIIPQLSVVDNYQFRSHNVNMSRDFFIKFGHRVRDLRLRRNMSQENLGLEAGFSGSFVGLIERAEKDISLSKVYKLANALGVSIKELF